MSKTYLTTTEAAKMLSVAPDTVLKWVKAGKIKAHRTLGGHYRITRQVVDKMGDGSSALPTEPERSPTKGVPSYRYCWEYKSGGDQTKTKCRDCIVFKSRASRCYELRDIPKEFGSLKLYCETTCQDCDYYKLVNEIGFNILVVTASARIKARLNQNELGEAYNIRVAANTYECAVIIEKFRPDFVIVDCAIGLVKSRELCRQITSDDRIPFTRLILTSKKNQSFDFCEREILGWIRKPFSADKLRQCLSRFHSRPPEEKPATSVSS